MMRKTEALIINALIGEWRATYETFEPQNGDMDGYLPKPDELIIVKEPEQTSPSLIYQGHYSDNNPRDEEEMFPIFGENYYYKFRDDSKVLDIITVNEAGKMEHRLYRGEDFDMNFGTIINNPDKIEAFYDAHKDDFSGRYECRKNSNT